jgi:hypothetical protein
MFPDWSSGTWCVPEFSGESWVVLLVPGKVI